MRHNAMRQIVAARIEGNKTGTFKNENKTRTPIFLRNDQAPPPTQKNYTPRHIYNASKKILAKI